MGLSVETQHGIHLGKIVNVEIDETAGKAVRFHVSNKPLVLQILHTDPGYLISREQVVSISDEKMVVVDLEVGETIDAGEEIQKKKKTSVADGRAPSLYEQSEG